MRTKGIALLEKDGGRDILKRVCRSAGVKIGLVETLIDAELEQIGKRRRHGLFERFDEILGEAIDGTDE